jgi:Trk K+ transport system NAD-binding subunit
VNVPNPTRQRHRRRRNIRTALLYALAVVYEFRWTLVSLCVAAALGTAVFASGPVDSGQQPSFWRALYAAWMALLAQPLFTPGPWYVGIINAIYPLFGVVLIGEGVIRFGWLMISRRRGEKEWMNVMASTYRDHVIIAGLGHLGYRIYEQLRDANVDVVIVDTDDDNPFVLQAKSDGAAVLIRNMQEDQSLIDAGVNHARAIIIATNKDMANLECALDARRMNPNIRVVMRLFDQRIAEKIRGALTIDVAFSSSSLAAPMVAAMALETKVLSSIVISGVPHVVSELKISDDSALAGKRIDEIEQGYSLRVLARTSATNAAVQSPPAPATSIEPGDTLVVHTATKQLASLGTLVSGGLGA